MDRSSNLFQFGQKLQVLAGWLQRVKKEDPDAQAAQFWRELESTAMPQPDMLERPNSVAQSRPFDLLVFPFWSSLSHGPKRLAFYFWVLWASEQIVSMELGTGS